MNELELKFILSVLEELEPKSTDKELTQDAFIAMSLIEDELSKREKLLKEIE